MGELNDQKNGNAVRYLIIVSSGEPDVYEYLSQRFRGDKRVAVILDRRRTERRQQSQPPDSERRQRDRRRAVREEFRSIGRVFIRRRQAGRES